MNIKKSLPVIIGFVILGIIFLKSYQGSLIRKKADAEFYKNFNKSFNGIVFKTYYYDLGPGKRNTYKFIYIKLIESSIKKYDIRDTTQKGFFIIRNDSAVLILSTLESEKIIPGDYLLFDGRVDTLYHYRTGYSDYTIYKEDDIISIPYDEATKLLPEDAKVITKWQPQDIIYGSTREFIAKKIKDF